MVPTYLGPLQSSKQLLFKCIKFLKNPAKVIDQTVHVLMKEEKVTCI